MDKETRLLEAALSDDIRLMRELIGTGADVNAQVPRAVDMMLAAWRLNQGFANYDIFYGMEYPDKGAASITAAAAAYSRDPEVIRVLAGAGADLRSRGITGLTPLMSAAAFNPDPRFVSTLLSLGARPNTMTKHGATALMFAARENRNPEVVRELLEGGASPSARDDGGLSVLMWAARSRHTPAQTFSYLIQYGADVREKGPKGSVLFMAAAFSRHPEVIRLLISAGADPHERNDKTGMTLFTQAVMENTSPEVIQALIDAGADINERNRQGQTPLMMACASVDFDSHLGSRRHANHDVVRLLVEAGAELEATDHEGSTALCYAVCFNPDPEVVDVMVGAGADIEHRDSYGLTPLMYWSRDGRSLASVRRLIGLGADVNAKDSSGMTALFLATIPPISYERKENPHANVSYELIPYGHDAMGYTQALLDAGADVNIHERVHGMTCLISAVLNRCPLGQVELLISRGADVNAVDNCGHTALDYAEDRGMRETLLKAGGRHGNGKKN